MSTLYPQTLEHLEARTCFATASGATPPPPPPPITVLADVNADGKADLISLYAQAPSSSTTTTGTSKTTTPPPAPKWELKIQLGKGDGTFSAGTETASPAQNPVAIAIGDLDGDGKADIAILNRDPAPSTATTTTSTAPPPVPHESVFILKTDGKGAVLPPPTTATAAPKPTALPEGLDASSIAITDLNKDGLQDLVAIGNLAPKPTTTTTTQPPKPVVTLATFLNTKTAKGTFQKPTLTATDANPGLYQLTPAGDLDKNGSPDLVAFQVAPPPANQQQQQPPTSKTTTTQPPPKNLALMFSNGDGTLRTKSQANPLLPPPPTTPTSQQQPPPVLTIGVTDIDGDGVADLIGANPTSILVSKFDPKTLTFQAPKPATSTHTPANLSATHLLLGDISGDGKSDLLSATDKTVTLGLNTSTPNAPAFSWSPIAPPPAKAS